MINIKSRFILFTTVFFVAISLFLTSCIDPNQASNKNDKLDETPIAEEQKKDTEKTDSSISALIGNWTASEYEQYIIGENDFTSLGCYSGKNLKVVKDSEDSGRIFIEYTKAYEATEVKPEDAESWEYYKNDEWNYEMWYRYSTTAPDVGKWYAICYKDLTKTSIKISGAFKNGGKTSCDTLEEAEKEFTVENGYFDAYSECVKTE